ncbi:unnamed protein product [Ectocarpus sp. 6 AP-2014]
MRHTTCGIGRACPAVPSLYLKAWRYYKPGDPFLTLSPPPSESTPSSLAITRNPLPRPSVSPVSAFRAYLPLVLLAGNTVFGACPAVADRDIHVAYDFTGPVLGKGSFATVLRVRDRVSGSEYAVKQIDLHAIKDSPSSLRMIERECRTMMTLSHPNIVRLQEVYRPPSADRLYMVLDRLEGGSVDGLWRRVGQLSDDHAAHIILQIVSAVRYCHDRGIAHRDLKMENCLYEDSSLVPIVKVIDFGLCAEMKDGVTSRAFVGTVLYTAPEILKVDGHNVACDLWSLGVMAFALVSGQFPWYSDSKDVCGQMIKYSPLQFPKEKWKGVSPLCRDFIEKCLVKKPKKRITAAQAQQHPWLQKAARLMEGGAPLSKESMMAMLEYQNGNTFQKIVMELVAYSYEPAQIKDLELDFLRMDKQGKGEISLEEFKDGLQERWAVLDDPSWPNTPPPGGDSSIFGTVSTQNGCPLGGGNNLGGSRSRHQDEASTVLSTWRHCGSGTLTNTSSGRASGKLANRRVRVGAKRSAAGKEGPPDVGGSGAPRDTAEPLDGRPRLDPTGDEGVVDPDALKAALLAVQADATVSREGLHRMLRAVQRKPFREDSEPVSSEGKVAHSAAISARSSVEASLIHGERDRRCMKMNDDWAEEIFRAMDHDHSGSITFTDFVAGCLVEKQVGEAALQTAFARLDLDRSGLISLDDVKLYLGEDFREDDMVRNMRAISTREDGQVAYNDFKKCLLWGALPNSQVVTPARSRSASFRALSKMVSSNDLNKMDVEGGKDLEAEERAVVKAASFT